MVSLVVYGDRMKPLLAGVGVVLMLAAACRVPSPHAPSPAGDDPRITRVTNALQPVVQVRGAPAERPSLATRMQHYRVPGVSIAVADQGRIVWARGFGVREAGLADRVTPTTPFEAASISKVIAATAALRLVDQGTVALDENVNRYLRTWQVPESRFTATQKVTLRRLLSHTAGVTGHSVGSYESHEPLPTLEQILDGKPPAKDAAIVVDTEPGTSCRYSGGGITIEQLLLTEVTGQSFATLIDRLVLQPLEMRDSTIEQPLPASWRARSATPHDVAGKRLPDQRYVQAAAAGLYTTPRDLLTWAIEMTAARDGRSQRVLSQATAQRMLTPEKPPFGLGPVVDGKGREQYFGHPGWNGGFHAELIYFPETGQGAVVMVNGDGGRPMVREILYAISAEYGWPDLTPTTIDAVTVDDQTLDRLVGSYRVEKPNKVAITVTKEGKQLFLDAPILGVRTALVFTTPTKAVTLSGDRFEIVLDPTGRVTGLQFGFLLIPRI
jgi:CubicO group peptidase (beta-lactamase class C family)